MTTDPTATKQSALIQAYRLIEELESKLDTLQQAKHEPIAIIGMGCRFPKAKDLASFWRLLRDGVDATGDIPAERWDVAAYYDPDPANSHNKMYIRRGAFLDDVDTFDAQFFGISPREAKSMDPQQRLLLEVCWEALEHAGLVPEQLKDTQTGVYVGLMTNDYMTLLQENQQEMDPYVVQGNGLSFSAGRLSYVLGLQGPSMTVATACSSSLVTTHLACQALRNRECDLALSGGTNLILSPQVNILLSKMQAAAADGRCKTFAAAADGYGRGEGCGVVVLKRLSDALAAGDSILALIRGSATNHNGSSGALTVPSGLAQKRLLRLALEAANVKAEDIDYVEAHGTGTALGDPIEVDALTKTMAGRSTPLLIGAVKTNIGHLEAAAGVAGLIKTVLALHHRAIPPHLHFSTPNPHI
ncbi:MAG TPA: polyketide synthase, partial [Anaerolineae bacterium]